ncbi:MAG: hypothetical protein H8M99_04830 [Gloeobacteraceae cyanobacterium ES-bin-144]|nr:hypothetical protein [Verrucomicrobiales bacterium]
MNPLLETILNQGLMFDSAGVIGLGFLALAAIKLSSRYKSWGGTMIAAGATALLIARLYAILAPHFVTNDFISDVGPIGLSIMIGLPPLLLSLGLASIVWGLWGHERWLNEASRS